MARFFQGSLFLKPSSLAFLLLCLPGVEQRRGRKARARCGNALIGQS
jgi:hypothetical protein